MSTFPPDLTDPRFLKGRVREITPERYSTRETVEQYLARGGKVRSCPPDRRENSPLSWWRPDDLAALQHGFHRQMPARPTVGGG